MSGRVLFVSKPIAAPFHDGSKCLVRDVARHLKEVQPVVMSTASALELAAADGSRPIQIAPVYRDAGTFTPALSDNLRVALFLLFRARADVWHFVFAPNLRSSGVGRRLSRLRGACVVQTIASAPRRFDAVATLLFGDIVVAQSEWTRERIEAAYDEQGILRARRPRIEVIPPPVAEIAPRSASEHAAVRRELGIAEAAPLFVYPGDLETSGGAEAVARAAGPLAETLPGAVSVFAYRNKSARAPEIAQRLEQRIGTTSARFTNSLPDVLALISGCTAVLFPVDDVWGKVDLPIVLLEAMALGVPVIALAWGPLVELGAAEMVQPGDERSLVEAAVRLATDSALRERRIQYQRTKVRDQFAAAVVASRYEELYRELISRRTRGSFAAEHEPAHPGA
jgi:phosphatidylinositol alpha-1,6-mannosyltransferase